MNALSSYLSAVRIGESGVEDFVKLAGSFSFIKGYGERSWRRSSGYEIGVWALQMSSAGIVILTHAHPSVLTHSELPVVIYIGC